MREEILSLALQRLKRKIHPSKKQRVAPTSNLELNWNHQLYSFIKLQLKTEREWKQAELQREPSDPITAYKSRKDMALLVAKSGGWGLWVMKRILMQEVAYIRHGRLPSSKQGKHTKVTSWLTDDGTMVAMQEYMSQAGEGMFNLRFI